MCSSINKGNLQNLGSLQHPSSNPQTSFPCCSMRSIVQTSLSRPARYTSSELFITELECLAFFNHFVTFPFLNCVEVSDQVCLLNILPKLYSNLLQKKTDTLEKFVVSIHGMPVTVLSTDVAKEITGMCISAAEALKRQCGREHGFAGNGKLQATDISQLTPEERAGLPTNNCISERDLSQFDKEAVVAHYSESALQGKEHQK